MRAVPSPVRREREKPDLSFAVSKAVGFAFALSTILPLPSDGRGPGCTAVELRSADFTDCVKTRTNPRKSLISFCKLLKIDATAACFSTFYTTCLVLLPLAQADPPEAE